MSAPRRLSRGDHPPKDELAALIASGCGDTAIGRLYGRSKVWAYYQRKHYSLVSALAKHGHPPKPRGGPVPAAPRQRITLPKTCVAIFCFPWPAFVRFADVPLGELAREATAERLSAHASCNIAALGDPPPGRRQVGSS